MNRRRVLIETSWNVKSVRNWRIPRKKKRINRNIVECKDNSYRNSVRWRFRINRNIVECKDHNSTMEEYRKNVLIETSWNVKAFMTIDASQVDSY